MAGNSIIPNAGERALLEMSLNRADTGSIKFRLYSGFEAGFALNADLTLAGLTEVGAGSGYAEVTATPGTWTYATDGTGHTRATYGDGVIPQTWDFSAETTVRGYYAVWDKGGDGLNEELLWAAEGDPTPVNTLAYSVIISYDLNQRA